MGSVLPCSSVLFSDASMFSVDASMFFSESSVFSWAVSVVVSAALASRYWFWRAITSLMREPSVLTKE